MSHVVLHGAAGSTYVRTARLALEEKGVAYELRPLKFKTAEHLAMHPWGKMPVLTHGDLVLFESAAICRYVDEAFAGPSLQPADAAGRARMMQWISVINAYVYEPVVRGLYFPARAAAKAGHPLDEAAASEALDKARHALSVLEHAHEEGTWLVGGQLSLADLFLGPLVVLAEHIELTARLLDDRPRLARAIGALQARPSWAATEPG